MYIVFHSVGPGKLYYVTQRASQPTTALYIIFHQHIFLEISGFTCQTTFWCDIVWHRWNSHMSVIRAPVLPSFLAWRMVQHISAPPREKARTGPQTVIPKRDPPIIHPAPSLLQDTSGLHCTSKSASEASSKDPSNLQRNTKVEVILKKMRVNRFLCRCTQNKHAKQLSTCECGIYLNKYVSINTQVV